MPPASGMQEVAPLALRLRPRSLDEFVGQEQRARRGSALRLAIAEDRVGSAILYGPPGTGKTTLARIVAQTTGAAFEELSAVSATGRDVREVLARARDRLGGHGRAHDPLPRRDPPLQQGAAGRAAARGRGGLVTLIGATTENPYFEVNSALLSRCQIYELEPLGEEELA
jgi:putative ATPase